MSCIGISTGQAGTIFPNLPRLPFETSAYATSPTPNCFLSPITKTAPNGYPFSPTQPASPGRGNEEILDVKLQVISNSCES